MGKRGFTLIEMVVVLAVVAILAAILVPEISKHINDSKVARTINEELVITAAITMLHKDTGKWPRTDADGPSGNIDRLYSGLVGDRVATEIKTNARPGAANWGDISSSKQLHDFLFYNNPDNDTGAVNQNESGQDYPTTGQFAWKGPYTDQNSFVDPWGNQYVISARYFPGNTGISDNHRAILLSAGADGLWSTAFSDSITRLSIPSDNPYGPYEHDGSVIHDDIGKIIATNN